MKKLIILLGLPLITTMSNSLGKQKSLLSLYLQKLEAKDTVECMRLLRSLLNEHSREKERQRKSALNPINSVVGTAKP